MSKLTIYQKKQYETWESEQEVSYESECLEELLAMVACMSNLTPANVTRYELKEVEAELPKQKTFEELIREVKQ